MLKTKKIVVSMLLVFALLFTGLGVSSMLPVKATDTDVAIIKSASLRTDDAHDYVTLYCSNTTFAFNQWISAGNNLDNVFVNGQSIKGKINAVLGGQGNQPDRFQIFIQKGTLKLDGTDVVEVKKGTKLSKVAGANVDYYLIDKDYKLVKGVDNTHLVVQVAYSPKVEMDADFNLIREQRGGGTIGAFTENKLTYENATRWGMTNGQVYGKYNANHFIKFEFVNPINPQEYSGMALKVIHNQTEVTVGLYPADATDLSADAPVKIKDNPSVRTVDIKITDLLSADGLLHGFILTTKDSINSEDGMGQFFVDSVTLKSKTAYDSLKLQDVNFDLVRKPDETEKIGGLNVGKLNLENNLFGMQDGSLWGNADATQVAKFELWTPVNTSVYPKARIQFIYNIGNSKVGLYPLGTTDLTAEAPILIAGAEKYPNEMVIDLTKLANEDGKFYGFIVAVKEGEGGQFFFDSFTPYSVMRTLTINVDGAETTKQYMTNESVTLDTPVKNGFTFTNWFEDADCTIPATIDTMPDHDYKIYAGFKANPYNVVVDGFSISTKGDIALNFYAVLSDDMLDGTMNAYKGETLIYKINIADATVANADHRKFSVPVPAKDMFEEITIKFNSSDGTTRKEAVHSVAEYINAIINDNSGNFEAEKPLLNELLRYGALAKVHFYGGTLPEGMVAPTLDASALNDFKATSVGTLPENVSILGYSLLLESNTSIRVYFTSTLATAPDTAYLVDGVAVVPVQVMDDDVKHQDADGNYVYYIEIKDIAAKDLVKDYVISIGGYQLTVCAVDYAGTVLNNPDSSADLQNLVKSLYLCSQEAVKYFPSNQQNILGFILPAQVDKSHVDLMKGAGLNGIFIGQAGPQVYTFNVEAPTEDNLNTVKLLGDNGIKSYIHVGKGAKYLKNIEKFADNPNIAGFLIDEPDKNDIAEVAKQVDSFNNLGKGKTLYVNLFPSFAPIFVTPEKKQYNSYLEYLEDVYNSILSKLDGERILSVDRYPIRVNKGDKYLDANWLKDVEIVRNFAKTHNLKTNFFVQTMALGKGGVEDREPTYEDIRVQEYALMAYGYDSISLFCYGTPDKNVVKFGGAGPINTDGTVNTTVYNNVAKADKEMIALEKILDNFAWQGVFTTKGSFNLNHSMNISAINSLTSVKSDHDGIVGYFKGIADGRDGFLAVNFNETTKVKSNNVKLNFDANLHYNKALVIRGGLATSVDISANTLTLNLGAGEGVFAIPYKA